MSGSSLLVVHRLDSNYHLQGDITVMKEGCIHYTNNNTHIVTTKHTYVSDIHIVKLVIFTEVSLISNKQSMQKNQNHIYVCIRGLWL